MVCGKFSWNLVNKRSQLRGAHEKSHIADSLWQIDGFNKPYAISQMPYANCSEASERNEVDGPFSAGSLGNGIGSTGQA